MRHQSFLLAPICALDGNSIIAHAPATISAGKLFYKRGLCQALSY